MNARQWLLVAIVLFTATCGVQAQEQYGPHAEYYANGAQVADDIWYAGYVEYGLRHVDLLFKTSTAPLVVVVGTADEDDATGGWFVHDVSLVCEGVVCIQPVLYTSNGVWLVKTSIEQ